MSLKPTYGHLKPDSAGAKVWREVMGPENDLMVPLLSPVAVRAPNLNGEIEDYYQVDLKRLKPEEHNRLAQIMARNFNLPLEDVLDGFADPDHGMPMLVSNFSGVSFDARLFL